jgi:hypothetical protein
MAVPYLRTSVRLEQLEPPDLIAELDLLREGDGMTLGYHGWVEGDYGEHPIAERQEDLRR